MIYIDSDGVLSDFDQWLMDVDCPNHNKSEEVYKTVIKYQDHAFIDSKPIKENNWIRRKMKRSDFKVLTSLPSKEDFSKFFDSEESFNKCYNKLKENKYLWFEKIGIPRNKVIITENRKQKFSYCKSKEDVLYDDYPDTITEWNKLGGTGILVRNAKCKAQKKLHYEYALANFNNVVETIRKGIYRKICVRNFQRIFHPVGERMCKVLAKHETKYFMEKIILPNLIYNPYTGKMYLTSLDAINLTVRTASDKEEPIELYLYNSFPKLFVKPDTKKNQLGFGIDFIKTQICKYMPEAEKRCGTKIISVRDYITL